MKIAKQSTARILRNIKDNPLIIQEVQFKLNQDIDGGLLVSLKDFLNREEVKQQGYKNHNIHEYLTASTLLLVFNPGSSSTKIWICAGPGKASYAVFLAPTVIIPASTYSTHKYLRMYFELFRNSY